ncbi:RloB family protein [Streptomyces sp. NPDC057638]|uniref:RloB family protein n=1 Tax=Streptomyces sp. NPDC057638 TaxID=3346190 RepID=UPI00369F1F65
MIYCEGECTEEHYFRGIKAELRALPVAICIGGGHGEPLSLVRSAIKHKKRAGNSSADRYTPYDEVWCVVDAEAPTQHPSLKEAIALAQRSGVRVALTNPCFELWLLLHFKDVSGYRTSASTQSALEKESDCGYAAQRKHLDYDKLRGPDGARHTQAVERARALRQRSADGLTTNPWTDVDILVDLLREARARP